MNQRQMKAAGELRDVKLVGRGARYQGDGKTKYEPSREKDKGRRELKPI